MPVKTWTLIDQAAVAPPPAFLEINHANQPDAKLSNVRIVKRTLSGGLADGVCIVEIHNDNLLIEVVPTRGMGIRRVVPRVQGKLTTEPSYPDTIGWQSPVRGPVHPAFVDVGEPSGLGWLDGFDELLVRCGLESNGAPEFDDITNRLKYPLHGRIANKPAHKVQVSFDSDTHEIKLVGVVEETRFHFLKLRMTSTLTTTVGSSSFAIHDDIENFSASPTTMQMLYHVNFGLPLLDGGSRVVLPAKTVVPRNARAAGGIKTWDSYAAPEPGFEEMVYFFALHANADGQTRTLLKNAHATRGVSLVFDTRQLPCFTIWKNTTGEPDGYVTGLEPGTNYPNPRSFETVKQRVVHLAGGAKQVFDLAMEIHATPPEVAAAEAAVAKIQAGREPQVFDQPQPDWCA